MEELLSACNFTKSKTPPWTIEFFEKISPERLERIKPKSVFFKFAFVEQLRCVAVFSTICTI